MQQLPVHVERTKRWAVRLGVAGRLAGRHGDSPIVLLAAASPRWWSNRGDPLGSVSFEALHEACIGWRKRAVTTFRATIDVPQAVRAELAPGRALQDSTEHARFADLPVMGCYGHGRARGFMLVAASRTVLASTTLPELMSH